MSAERTTLRNRSVLHGMSATRRTVQPSISTGRHECYSSHYASSGSTGWYMHNKTSDCLPQSKNQTIKQPSNQTTPQSNNQTTTQPNDQRTKEPHTKIARLQPHLDAGEPLAEHFVLDAKLLRQTPVVQDVPPHHLHLPVVAHLFRVFRCQNSPRHDPQQSGHRIQVNITWTAGRCESGEGRKG
eukprot:2461633-Rhodomonas_salina.1